MKKDAQSVQPQYQSKDDAKVYPSETYSSTAKVYTFEASFEIGDKWQGNKDFVGQPFANNNILEDFHYLNSIFRCWKEMERKLELLSGASSLT